MKLLKVTDLQLEKDESVSVCEMTEGQRIFDYIKRNNEVGDRIMLEVIEMSQSDYDKACKRGDEMA